MTAEDRLTLLEEEVGRRGTAETLTNLGRHDGYLFTKVQGVTVVIGDIARNANGGFKVPSLRTYPEVHDPTNLHAAARAGELFAKQKARDDENPEKAKKYGHGHLGAIVDFEWQCDADECPCRKNEDVQDRRKRSLT